ncbi:hypothetical protein KHS38_06960 [Mucilaginibacter sp. Bleaf8]|uniref:hypothetical protein n=1 Tax=Mucilaginibacter sp. Bleaf8 TaxID=2834430 RepID=UPI001BCB28BC|nr:hypothetical protein [Mucilaginibacter sp. Bleaf8]MBS7564141.1 hypothetical protein [Mucilaginibacter sp. Bleaf8]
MVVVKKTVTDDSEKEWENPQNPEAASDPRDEEQLARQKKEAELRKENLTETDHIDKVKKTE